MPQTRTGVLKHVAGLQSLWYLDIGEITRASGKCRHVGEHQGDHEGDHHTNTQQAALCR